MFGLFPRRKPSADDARTVDVCRTAGA